jgi:nitroreductase
VKDLEQVLEYHQATVHHLNRFARGPGYLDWATQPDPFRRYRGAPLLPLERIPPGEYPPYEPALVTGHVAPAPLSLSSLSQLFFDSLALSAWKRAGNVSWALRVNPSSGNLHPTEGYLVCGPVPRLNERPMVAHYAPREHGLEVRAEFPLRTWRALVAGLPVDTILVGLSSIHWREAWKYGERAFRYCQHDIGHAIAAVSIAAAGLGWQATLLDDLGTEQLGHLMGLGDPQGAEAEHPDCLLAVYPQGQAPPSTLSLPERSLAAFAGLSWQGEPNLLSPAHVDWPVIDDIAAATVKPPTEGVYPRISDVPQTPEALGASPISLRQIIRQRRSAVAMDGRGSIRRDALHKILRNTLPSPGRFPFNAMPWQPLVHLVLFVHRVENLASGLYLLLRDPGAKEALRPAMAAGFAWEKPSSCPPDLALYRLLSGDTRAAARQLSCRQEIASDGCFSLSMIAEFEGALQRFGPWFYRRLFWECGLIGQVLYLEAGAAGVRGTGIGCFFDDAVHELSGLKTEQYRSLYHFTIGHPVEDARLTTLPAYPR